MITDKRKLWLMINCKAVIYTTQEAQSEHADNFVRSINEEELKFCLDFMKR